MPHADCYSVCIWMKLIYRKIVIDHDRLDTLVCWINYYIIIKDNQFLLNKVITGSKFSPADLVVPSSMFGD